MGHLRLGRLPVSQDWERVVSLLQAGGSVADLAAATARAADKELTHAKGDPALAWTVWLLTQLPLAARSDQFVPRLNELGLPAGAEKSLLSLTAAMTLAVDGQVSGMAGRTDLGEMARLAATESLTAAIGPRLPSLLGATADDVRRELARLGTKDQFGKLARDFFSRLTRRVLEYYISRSLPDHVGPGRKIADFDQQMAFRAALERHCQEASLIVEDFAGSWFSKNTFRATLTPQSAQAFSDYALKKMRDELRARGSGDA